MAGQRGGMLIALLAVLGVDLSVIVALMAVVLARKRWVSRRPGAFKGAIRVIEGEVRDLAAAQAGDPAVPTGARTRRGPRRGLGGRRLTAARCT